MENNLEQLLNSLIEKGWLPRNIKCKSVKSTDNCLEFYTELKTVGRIMKNERQLVSKESNLWQFVCENGMVKKPDIDRGEVHNWDNPNHWLCESSLKDESELEDFLLSNIKVDAI